MCTLYERIIDLCKERGVTGSRVCLELGISKSTLSDIKSGRKKSMHPDTIQKFATYFGVSVDYLLGNEKKETPLVNGDQERSVSDDDIKFALFGGDGDITDAMYERVKQFAAFIKQEEADKKKE